MKLKIFDSFSPAFNGKHIYKIIYKVLIFMLEAIFLKQRGRINDYIVEID